MLEALVALCRGPDGTIGGMESWHNKIGDIICVKRSPTVWGLIEMQHFLIAYLDDPALEAQLGVNHFDSWSLPYASYDSVLQEDSVAHQELINRSVYRVDITMFSGSPGLDPNVASGVVSPNGKFALVLSDLLFDDAPRSES